MRALITIILFAGFGVFNQATGQAVRKGKDQFNGNTYNYYYTEPQGATTGILILLPGTGEQIKSIFSKTKLPQLLADKGFVTIIPEVHSLLYADQYTIDELDQLLKTQLEKYKVTKYVIGGFSSGGAIATRYAEYLSAKNNGNNLKGLIAVDPPLDLQRVYASAERMIKNCSDIIKKEGYRNKSQLETAFGGSPAEQHDNYIKYSSFLANEPDGGNARYLKNLPIRFYSEPDLAFVQKTYCTALEFNDINASDLEALNKFLTKEGNTRVEYITTQGRGFHSWNIIEPEACANWIVRICQ